MTSTIGRRQFVGGALVLGAAPTLWRRPAILGAPGVEQVHLQFGKDPGGDMTVSWVTAGSVAAPKLRYGTAHGGLGTTVDAATSTYRDYATGREIVVHHAALAGLDADTDHVYQALHDGGTPVDGGFRTAPSGPAKFRFTSFGDQGITGEGLGSDASTIVVDHIEQQAPLFHLVNGDLAYSDLHADPARAWDKWFTQNQPSAAARPWMPAAGNHEQETGNGDTGYLAFQTRFLVPDNGVDGLDGLFYAFTVGTVRFVVVQNDDVCYQWGTNDYVRGYSGGEQKAWLDRTLAAAAGDPAIDWIVVCMHQLVMSSSVGNGGDLGIREEFAPLFDRHGVDLVLCGHDHDYERTHPVRGVDPDSPLLRPQVVDTDGAVHLVLGGGGSIPTASFGVGPKGAKVNVGKGEKFAAELDYEEPVWSAVTDKEQAWGFAAFDVDPGAGDGAPTSIDVTYYRTAAAAGGAPAAYDTFRLEKPSRIRKAAPPSPPADDDGIAWPTVTAAAGAAAVATAGGVALRKRLAHPAAPPSEPQGSGTDQG